jgi:hypothetical protein
MKTYIEAFDENGNQVLGSLDGQNVLTCQDYRKTKHWKRLVNEPKEKLSLGGRVVRYHVVSENGKILSVLNK